MDRTDVMRAGRNAEVTNTSTKTRSQERLKRDGVNLVPESGPLSSTLKLNCT